jgi:hypothetical protein
MVQQEGRGMLEIGLGIGAAVLCGVAVLFAVLRLDPV